jgi:hypothetical protein
MRQNSILRTLSIPEYPELAGGGVDESHFVLATITSGDMGDH